MRQNKTTFVYCWSDIKTNKVYVGMHTGSFDDKYICSSKHMLKEYKERPQDFTRQIIGQGTLQDCVALEYAINKELVKNLSTCYNRCYGKMIVNEVHPMLGRKHSDETKKKMAEKRIGSTLSKEHIASIKKANIGRKQSSEHIAKRIANRLKTMQLKKQQLNKEV